MTGTMDEPVVSRSSRCRGCRGGRAPRATGEPEARRRGRTRADQDRDDREELDQPGLSLRADAAPKRRPRSCRQQDRRADRDRLADAAQEDGQVQAQRIAQAVNDGADAILISCSDAGKVTGAINDAVARGVPVMTFDSDAPQSKRFAFYGVDDIKTGQAVMDELAKLMGGKGKVAILAGNQNAPNLQKRVEGVKDEAAKHPGIKIVGTFYHVETPQDAAAEVVRVAERLSRHPGLGDDRRLAAVHADAADRSRSRAR